MEKQASKNEMIDEIFQSERFRLQARVMQVREQLEEKGIRYYSRFLQETNPKYEDVRKRNDVHKVISGRIVDTIVMEEVVNDMEAMLEKLTYE